MVNSKLTIKICCVKRFAPVKEAVEKCLKEGNQEPVLIAIDGKCASGKTTLGYYLKENFECNLFHMDDFFLQDHQRTPERLKEVGGNVDYERFLEEVIEPIQYKKEVHYRPFSCKERKIGEETIIPYKQLNIIEGSYSLHPYFKAPYHLKVFMNISKAQQLENILRRNGEEKLVRFREEWIPKEEKYFKTLYIGDDCIQLQWD